ncbi:MAG TPA: AraC family transcriptional regulator [Lachnoclostridium phytofermentans]|uniref:AraC family transcriptional regulator n=1 Tax=Lachnoclostridium phytofermentans TaxID=66219 RepID=A0A3D2X116_9FIRM|nr:helix-turn-helix domain-containing protein [Lachnoclostridium sp.]HCL00840.1 AraC family transcriptional regulator [Lachnoclostridium phytofermentans]
MKNAILNNLSEDNRRKIRLRQDTERFHRVVNGNYELVKYLPGSSIRIWYNVENIDFSTHWHPAFEIIIPLENTYTVRVSNEEYLLHPGDILIIPAGELHYLMAPNSGSRLIYLFDSSIISKLNGFSYLIPYISQPILMSQDTHSQIYTEEANLLEKMCEEYFSDNNLRELAIYSHLLNFFVTLGRYRMNVENTFSYVHQTKQKELIDKLNIVFDYLDQHYMEDITLEKVASVAGFSKFHFSRLFKQCSGQNFYDFLCFKRIKSAEMLLLNPDLTITEIALQSGFSSLSTFNRTFKRSKNCTPTEYRDLCSKGSHPLEMNP